MTVREALMVFHDGAALMGSAVSAGYERVMSMPLAALLGGLVIALVLLGLGEAYDRVCHRRP